MKHFLTMKVFFVFVILLIISSPDALAWGGNPRDEKSAADTTVQAEYLSGNKDQILQLLQERAAYQELSLVRQQRFIYALSIFSIILLAGGILLVRLNRKRRLANDLLALKSLRSQMNPHFIFNSLNSINGFIASQETREANKYLSDFSRLMRIVLDNSTQDLVSLEDEISALSLYLSLEQVRFRDQFTYTFTVDPSIVLYEHQIPPMLVQPYIENAIWHGLRYKQAKGLLTVSIQQTADGLVLKVTDDGIGREASQRLKTTYQKSHTSLGMRNTEERIQLLNRIYRHPISVHISDLTTEKEPGTAVVIKLPQALTEEIR